MKSLLLSTIPFFLVCSCAPWQKDNSNGFGSAAMGLRIESSAFGSMGVIPEEYTCDGLNRSVPLSFSGVPTNTKSLVLIMEDPDVPKTLRPDGMFDHWLVWNIPPSTLEIPAGTIPPGIIGRNTKGTVGYTGPCPPDREHRYFFKLYALDVVLDISIDSNKAAIESAMGGHIVEQSELVGVYNRPQK